MGNVASSSQTPIVRRPPGFVQLSDFVWELYNPSSIVRVPEVEVIFFHGLQLDHYEEAFWRTWLSRDNTVVWPRDWLSERFPKARILSVSYLSDEPECQTDPYIVAANLIYDMFGSDVIRVGQNCPVVLVGHSVGGIVIKHFIVNCLRQTEEWDDGTSQLKVDLTKKFLENCRGVFYYSTPHSGSSIPVHRISGINLNSSFMKLLEPLDVETARINESFRKLRHKFRIKTLSIVEGLETNLRGFSARVVTEASARADGGEFYKARDANHFDICKPNSQTSPIFAKLVQFVRNILESDGRTVCPGVPEAASFPALRSLYTQQKCSNSVVLWKLFFTSYNLKFLDCYKFVELEIKLPNYEIMVQSQVVKNGGECQGLPNYPVELDSRARDIEKLLPGKAVIGISGMGGIGKTTVAKKVYNDISKIFDYTCFAGNVKGIQIHDLEDWLLRRFHKSGTRMEGALRQWSDLTRMEGARRQWSDFKGRKTMIVLDDVDSTDQISVLPKLTHFGEGSCIILTSRDEGVFKYFDDFEYFELYKVKFLDHDEAKKLFCQHAFGIQNIPNYGTEKNHLKEDVEAVVKKCKGLPLMLEVIGCYLKNEDNPKVWEETIDKLRQAESIDGDQNDRVWAALRVSYEALAKEEQDMFIEAGTYFFGKKLDVALAAWSSISENSENSWKNLVRRSMVKENQDKTVWVHEHLRAPPSWIPTKRDMVSGSDEKVDKLVRQVNTKQVNAGTKILRLECPHLDRTLELQRIAELKELKYLELDGVETKGSGKDFSSTLSLLRWKMRGRPKSQLPITLMPSLAVLELRYWDVPKGFPEALSNLTNLRHLSLWELKGLEHLPENFGNLSRLKYLSLAGLRLHSLPKSFGNLAALEHLELLQLDVFELPESFGNLSSLVELRIDDCKTLARLPASFGPLLTSLQKLNITRCPLLECLPDSFSLPSSLQQLSQLSLSNCQGLKELGVSFGNLRALEDLNLGGTGIERLPDSFSQLSRLQRLSLFRCESLKELGDSFGSLSALKFLDFDNTCIGKLPETFGHLMSLEKLKCEFNQAKLLPDKFCLLTSLRELSIKSASLERLPDSLGELFRLEELHLHVDNVSALPESMEQLPWLQNLYILSEKLERLPYSERWLSSLKVFSVVAKTSVGILRSIFTSVEILSRIGKVSSLQTLYVGEYEKSGDDKLDCDDSVEKLPDCFGELCSLREMDIDCGNLKELPDSLGMLPSLESLKIVAGKLESLPQSIGQLRSLRTMELKVPSIRCLPERMNDLSSLREFSFECDGHDRVPDHFEHLPFPSLAVVLRGSESVPQGIGKLSSLQDLTLEFENVKSLPGELGELSSLQTLTIICPSLETLPDSLGCLSSLRELRLVLCRSLKSLPDSLGRSSSSQQAQPHGAVCNDEEPSFQTPAAGANASELTLYVIGCTILNELRMRRLGWVLDEGFGEFDALKYRRRPDDVPDNVPLGSAVI